MIHDWLQISESKLVFLKDSQDHWLQKTPLLVMPEFPSSGRGLEARTLSTVFVFNSTAHLKLSRHYIPCDDGVGRGNLDVSYGAVYEVTISFFLNIQVIEGYFQVFWKGFERISGFGTLAGFQFQCKLKFGEFCFLL